MSRPTFPRVTALIGLVALGFALAGDWRSIIGLALAFGFSAGWSGVGRGATFGAVLVYVALGVGAEFARWGAFPFPPLILSAAISLWFATFFGYALGSIVSRMRTAAPGPRAATQNEARPIWASEGGGAARSDPPSPWPGATRPAAAPPPRSLPERMPPQGAPSQRPHAKATLPKGWKPTVSPRKRGLFS